MGQDNSEYNGKFFVIQKGMAQCDQGFTFPKFNCDKPPKTLLE